jgi:flagellar P-ring protein precursor FlgI
MLRYNTHSRLASCSRLAPMIVAALLASVIAPSVIAPSVASASRVKDVADLAGVRDNQLIGYGIVVGLDGTGDSAQSLFTVQSVVAMLSRMGIRVDPASLRTKNAAAVMVTAKLPPFATPGTEIDVIVSSMGDSKSLKGGTLLLTPLKAVDQKVYAMAQGPMAVGGYSAQNGGTRVVKNHPTVGRIPGGASIERALGIKLEGRSELVYQLKVADFTTASNVAIAITKSGVKARALDARRISVEVPEDQRDEPVALIAKVESVTVVTDTAARIVINARTGTVVMGANVRLNAVALAHGGLQVEVDTSNSVSQPGQFAGGNSRRVRNSRVNAVEGGGRVHLVEKTASLGDLVEALNRLGVSPRDLIDIVQAMRSAGALDAELEIQ